MISAWKCPKCGSNIVNELNTNVIEIVPIIFSGKNRFEYCLSDSFVEVTEDSSTLYRCKKCGEYTTEFGTDIWKWAEKNNMVER